jgi:hypothetical protein
MPARTLDSVSFDKPVILGMPSATMSAVLSTLSA